MNLLTIAMITQAGEDVELTVAQHMDTKKWHGLLYGNHPTPSGCERWLLLASDPVGFDTAEEAREHFKDALIKTGIKIKDNNHDMRTLDRSKEQEE